MAWVQWDNEKNIMTSVVKELPPSIADLPVEVRASLGYRELYVEEPEDFIQRFRELAGAPHMELMPDGRIRQHYPDADFSVAAVRGTMANQIKSDAKNVLSGTDWVFIRKMETGQEPPEGVLELRRRQRAHEEWLQEKLRVISERDLIDFKWYWPMSLDVSMNDDGVPVISKTGIPLMAPDAVTMPGPVVLDDTVISDPPPNAPVVNPMPYVPMLEVTPVPPPTTDGPAIHEVHIEFPSEGAPSLVEPPTVGTPGLAPPAEGEYTSVEGELREVRE